MSHYAKQKGLLPMILSIIGGTVHLIFIGGTFPFIAATVIRMYSEEPLLIAIITSVEYILEMIAFIWSIPLIIGSFFVSAFPEIKLSDKGLEYRVYRFLNTTIPWDEIAGIIDLQRGYRAVEISRKGFPLFNGLYSNRIYGDIIKSKHPVLLLSPGLEDLDGILEAIKKRVATRAGGNMIPQDC